MPSSGNKLFFSPVLRTQKVSVSHLAWDGNYEEFCLWPDGSLNANDSRNAKKCACICDIVKFESRSMMPCVVKIAAYQAASITEQPSARAALCEYRCKLTTGGSGTGSLFLPTVPKDPTTSKGIINITTPTTIPPSHGLCSSCSGFPRPGLSPRTWAIGAIFS